jgi:hypothetical protein
MIFAIKELYKHNNAVYSNCLYFVKRKLEGAQKITHLKKYQQYITYIAN